MATDDQPTLFTALGQELSRGESSPGFWRAQVTGWLILALIGFSIRLAIFGDAVAAFWLTLSLEPLAFLMTSAAALWHGRVRSASHSSLLVLACAVLLCVAASALLAWIALAIHQLFPPDTLRVLPENQYRLGFLYYMGIFSIWTLVYFGVAAELAARTARLSRMKAETHALRLELEHLQSQIEPHFLFNALNTIVAEIDERPAIASEMTRRLAAYLRYSLDRRGQGLCRLGEELEAAEAYVRIQALRFDRELEYRCHIDPASLPCFIPHMTLQGLVENAIKHGMRADTRRFVINVRTRRRDDELIVAVDNPGELHAPYDLAKGGGGLGNLCRRLALCYPDRYEFSLHQRQERIVAEIRLRGDPVTP